jgi:hypothetical protein
MGKDKGHKDRKDKKWYHTATGIKPKHEPEPTLPGVPVATVDMAQSTFSKVFNVVVRLLVIAVFAYVIWYYILPLV